MVKRFWARDWHRAVLAAVISLLSLGTPSGADAQQVVVVTSVADAVTGASLEGALVRLPALGRAARTNWAGQATITGVPAGTHRIEVRMVGYAPASVDMLARGDTVGPVFLLERSVVQLAETRAEAARASVVTREFYQRRAMGIGRFLDDTVLAREGTRSLAQLVATRFPGLEARPDPTNGFRYSLTSRRQPTNWLQKEPCSVAVYLDGVPFSDELDALRALDLIGAELYSYASAPPQYRTGRRACHVLLLWSNWAP